MAETQRDLAFYQSLSYPVEVLPSRDEGVVVFHPDLDGCDAQGETIDEALAKLKQARSLWLRARWGQKLPIPDLPNAEPSGRMMVRVPIRLHARLDQFATVYGKSLNRLNNELLFNYANALPAEYGLGEPEEPAEEEGEREAGYSYRLTVEEDGGFVAEHPDLPGCISQGETAEEARRNLDEARELWLESRRENGLPKPKPLSTRHSGVIHLRISQDLHASLAREAQRNACSLNQSICLGLAEGVGRLGVVSLLASPILLKKQAAALRAKLHQEILSLGEGWSDINVDELPDEHLEFYLALVYFRLKLFERTAILFLRASQRRSFEPTLQAVYTSISGRLGEIKPIDFALTTSHSLTMMLPLLTAEEAQTRRRLITALRELPLAA